MVKSIGFPAIVLAGFAVATCEKPCPGVGVTWSVSVVARFVATGLAIVIVLLLVLVKARTALTLNTNVRSGAANGVALEGLWRTDKNDGNPVTLYTKVGSTSALPVPG